MGSTPPSYGAKRSAMGLSPCYGSDLSAMGLPPCYRSDPLLWV